MTAPRRKANPIMFLSVALALNCVVLLWLAWCSCSFFREGKASRQRVDAEGRPELAAGLSGAHDAGLQRRERQALLHVSAVALLSALSVASWLVLFRATRAWEAKLTEKDRCLAEQAEAAKGKLQREITERGHVEKSLLEQSQLINGVLQNMPVIAFQIGSDGLVRQSVGAGLARFGGGENESGGNQPAQAYPQTGGWINRALSGENLHFKSEGISEGKPWAFDNFVAFDKVRGSGAFGFAIDITDYRQTREREEQLRAELAHMARVKSMGEMASGMAHELNQPLAAILMQAEVATHKIHNGSEVNKEELLETTQQIAEQAYRAGQIIRRMKDYVKGSAPRRTTINLPDVVDEVLALLESELRHADIAVFFDRDQSLPMIQGDKIQLQQVLMNLIRNAMEAMQPTTPGLRHLAVRATAHDGVLEVAVSDTGVGIPHDLFERLFGTFYSTKSEGMGMGLAICRSIVEAHGGRIWATPNSDRGTTFSFTLPITLEDCKDEIPTDCIHRG